MKVKETYCDKAARLAIACLETMQAENPDKRLIARKRRALRLHVGALNVDLWLSIVSNEQE